MQRQSDLLAERYDLADRPIPGVMMSGGRKAVQGGVRVRLPEGQTWDGLAALRQPRSASAVCCRPASCRCRTSSRRPAARSSPSGRSRRSRREEQRDLRRFDVDFDLPEHLTPEFPPPIFLTTHPELGDVSTRPAADHQELLRDHERPHHAGADGRPAPAADAVPAGGVQPDRGPQGGRAEHSASPASTATRTSTPTPPST